MITIPEAVEGIVLRSPTLAEGLSQGILNLSAVARVIQSEVQSVVMKDVQQGAVVMALNRLARRTQGHESERGGNFSVSPDLMIRSHLMEITFALSDRLIMMQKKLLDRVAGRREYFITITRGIFETTIIASRELEPRILEIFQGERILALITNLSSLTVQLPPGATSEPGVYAFLLRALAWAGINVVEVVSTLNEMTIILSDDAIDRAFSVIKTACRK